MRSQNTFYFFITDSLGRSAYWDNNIVRWQTTPRPLEFSPEGWKDTQPGFTRSNKYFGINRQFTTPYKFVEDGAFILRYLQYTKLSYETKVYLIICKWNDQTDIYESYYRGEIDLVKAEDDSAVGISANIIEGDLLKLLNANDGTDYEIPVDGDYTKLVQVDGVVLQVTQPFQQIALSQLLDLNHIPPFVELQGDGTPVYLEFHDQNYEAQIGIDATFYEGSQNYFARLSEFSPKPLTFRLHGNFRVTLVSSDDDRGVYILYTVISSDTGFNIRTQLENHVFDAVGDTYVFAVDETITLQPGEKLFLAGRAFVNFPGDAINFEMAFGEEQLSIDADDRYRPSIVKCIAPFDLYKQLLNKVFNGATCTAISTLLDVNYKHLLVTCGDAIRELEDAVIKTNFTEFFEAFNRILFAGFGISGLNAIFERRQYFFDASVITLNLDEVSNLNISVAEDQLNNTAKVGYPVQDIESLNGKYSFNNTSQFALPVVKIKKEYDQVSNYLTDPYVIESIRVKFGGKTTTDSKTDNKTFILNTIEKDGFTGISIGWNGAPDFTFTFFGRAADIASYEQGDFFSLVGSTYPLIFDGLYTVVSATVVGSDLVIEVAERPVSALAAFTSDITFPLQLRREAYTAITGVPSTADVYNIEDLTPKRMFLKHAPYYRALLYFFTLERIVMTTADRNKELSTTLNGVTITEKASVRVDTLGDPLFYPYIFTFKTRVPYTFMSLFKSAVNGHVQFSYNGFTLYGFPISMSVKPGLNEAQEWKLLASPLCNLPVLVDLLANPLNNINMAAYGLSFSMLCPVQMVPQGVIEQDVYNFRHMDLWTFEEQSTRYTDWHPYGQKWQLSDNIHLQCISRNLGPVQVDIINRHGRVFGTYSLTQVATSAVASPYQLFQGDINLSVSGLNPGCYRLRCTAGIGAATVVFLSEWLNIAERWPNTLLFEYTNTRNQAATIFTEGYTPSYRIEGNIIDFVPRSRFSSYEDEPANQYLLEGVAYRQFTLFAGDSFGLPPWAIDKLNRIMTLNTVSIDGKRFVRNEDAQFEAVNRVNGLPGTWWRMEIREAFNLDNTSMTTDNLTNERVVLIHVDSAEFGDLTDQGQVSSNPVQITVLNP